MKWSGWDFSVGAPIVEVMAMPIFDVSEVSMVCTCTDEEEVKEKLEAARDTCSPHIDIPPERWY